MSGYGRSLWAAVLAFCASVVALYLPRLPPFEPLEFNWQGKVLATGVAAAVIVAYPHLTWRRVGLGLPRAGWVRPFASTLAAFVVAGLLLNPATSATGSTSAMDPGPATPTIREKAALLGARMLVRGAPGLRLVVNVEWGRSCRSRRRQRPGGGRRNVFVSGVWSGLGRS